MLTGNSMTVINDQSTSSSPPAHTARRLTSYWRRRSPLGVRTGCPQNTTWRRAALHDTVASLGRLQRQPLLRAQLRGLGRLASRVAGPTCLLENGGVSPLRAPPSILPDCRWSVHPCPGRQCARLQDAEGCVPLLTFIRDCGASYLNQQGGFIQIGGRTRERNTPGCTGP